jgi:hypothetical protein
MRFERTRADGEPTRAGGERKPRIARSYGIASAFAAAEV